MDVGAGSQTPLPGSASEAEGLSDEPQAIPGLLLLSQTHEPQISLLGAQSDSSALKKATDSHSAYAHIHTVHAPLTVQELEQLGRQGLEILVVQRSSGGHAGSGKAFQHPGGQVLRPGNLAQPGKVGEEKFLQRTPFLKTKAGKAKTKKRLRLRTVFQIEPSWDYKT